MLKENKLYTNFILSKKGSPSGRKALGSWPAALLGAVFCAPVRDPVYPPQSH